jgi:DNA-binding CsgD family transcriptional regulator
LSTERGFDVVRVRTIGAALSELRRAHGGGGYFDCCVLARELDGSALEIAEAAPNVRPEPFLVALESERWLENERKELEDNGARFLPVPLTPRRLLDLLERGELDPVRHWAKEQLLSHRPCQVLSFGFRGAIDAQIATILGLSESTVHDHWRAACRRTRTDNRWDLIARVARDITKRASWPPLAL